MKNLIRSVLREQNLIKTEPFPIKVAISYRVLQRWRVPVFERLAARKNIELLVLYGDDFLGSKVVSFKGKVNFNVKCLPTFRVIFRSKHGKVLLPLHKGLWSALRQFDPDVIITEGASNALNNLICFLFARFYRKKIVQWGLGELQGRKTSLSRKLLNVIFFDAIERRSDAALAYSSRGAAYYKKIGIAANHVHVAVNSVDTDAKIFNAKSYASSMQLPWPSPVPDQFCVIFVGALTENKGLHLLLRTFAKFHSRFPDVRLSIVGEGDLRSEVEREIDNLGLTSCVKLHGEVYDDISKYFYEASVMVMPGLGGLAVSDALAHGVPVICGIGDGSEADLIDGTNGMILLPFSQPNLLDRLTTLYCDSELQILWRRNAMKSVLDKNNIGNYVDVIEKCVKNLLF